MVNVLKYLTVPPKEYIKCCINNKFNNKNKRNTSIYIYIYKFHHNTFLHDILFS